MLIVLLIISLNFLQALIKDVVFYLSFSHVFFQVVSLGHNVLAHTNDGFTNRNQNPINHFWLASQFFQTFFYGSSTTTKFMIFTKSKDKGDGLEGFSKLIKIRIVLLWIGGQNIGTFPKFCGTKVLLLELMKLGSMWSEYLWTLLFALQLEKNVFNLTFTSNFRSATTICNFNQLKPKTLEVLKISSTFQPPSSCNLQLLKSKVPSTCDPKPKTQNLTPHVQKWKPQIHRTLKITKNQKFEMQHSHAIESQM